MMTSDEDLVARALSTLPKGEAPAGLADRAFAAAMRAERPAPSNWSALFGELLAVSRVAAGAAGAVAAALLVVAFTRAAPASVSVVSERDEQADEWVAAVMPFAVDAADAGAK